MNELNQLKEENKRLKQHINNLEQMCQICNKEQENEQLKRELEIYRIKDTYGLAKFVEHNCRTLAISKLEKIKDDLIEFEGDPYLTYIDAFGIVNKYICELESEISKYENS